MNQQQLYIAVGLPTIVALIGILVNIQLRRNQRTDRLFGNTINSRLTSLESRVGTIESKFDTKFDLLIGKVFEMDNRLTRLEERLKH